MITRVIVCGCKDFEDRELCFRELNDFLKDYDDIEIVSGHAKGADTFGEEYAKEHSLKLKVFKPEWNKYGRAAGPIRNREMLKYSLEENPAVIAFWNGSSRGTKDMVTQARKANVKVKIVNI